MADKFILDKKQLLESIQDGFQMADGDISGLFQDLQASLSAENIEGIETDDFVKSLLDNEDKMRAFYSEQLEELQKGNSIVVPDVTIVGGDTTVNSENPPAAPNGGMPEAEKSFREMLDQQLDANQDFIGTFMNSADVSTDAMEAVRAQISNTINREIFDQTGESFDPAEAEKIVEEAMKEFVDSSREEQEKQTKSMFGSVNAFYDGVGNKMGTFFDSTAGGILYDALNVVSLGSLGVVGSLWNTAGRFLGVVEDMGGVVGSMFGSAGKMKDAVGAMYDGISTQVDKVFGDEKAALIDPAMDAAKGAGNALGVLKDKDTKSLDLVEESNNLLGDILTIQEEQLSEIEKQRLIDERADGEEGGIGKWLDKMAEKFSFVLFGIGVALGGLVGAIWKPFSILGKGIKYITSLFTEVATIGPRIMTTLGRIPKFGVMITNVIGKIGQFVSYIGNMGKGLVTAGKTMKFIGPLIGGFAKGFAKLAWPLQILMGAIDFFKGFVGSSETTFLGKLKDGVKGAILGFFNLPLKLLGWVFDKVLSVFGVESAGTGDKLIEWFSGLMDAIFDPIVAIGNRLIDFVSGILNNIWEVTKSSFAIFGNIFGALWNLLTGDFTGFGDNVKAIWDNVKNILLNILDGVFSWLTLPFRVVWDALAAQFENIKTFLSQFKIFDPLIEMFDKIGSFISKIVDWVKDKMTSIPLIGGLFEDEKVKLTADTNETKAKIQELQTDRQVIAQRIQELTKEGLDHDAWGPGGTNADKIKKLEEKSAGLLNQSQELESGISDRAEEKTSALGSVGEFFGGAGNQLSAITSGIGGGDSSSPMMASVVDPYNRPSVTTAVDSVEIAKQAQMSKQIEQTERISKVMELTRKDAKLKTERPIIVNTTGTEERKMIEPPTDIESMSILWLNKSWGLG